MPRRSRDRRRRGRLPVRGRELATALFKLVICESGRGGDGERRFVWGRTGQMHKVDHGSSRSDAVVVPLNEANPAFGYLEPPHAPGNRRPRLEIAFAVNADRWPSATVQNVRIRRVLMHEASVVRLLSPMPVSGNLRPVAKKSRWTWT